MIADDNGWPLNPDGCNKTVKIIGEKAGIKQLHPHMSRHTFVSLLMSNPDIGVATVAAEAGHAQPSTTLMIYTQQYKKAEIPPNKQSTYALIFGVGTLFLVGHPGLEPGTKRL